MTNGDFANIFELMAEILELKNASRFRILAYQKAAREIDHLADDLEDIYRRGGLSALEAIPGVGESVGTKIEELIHTGKCREFERLKKQTPPVLLDMLTVSGIGAKTAQKLYRAFKPKSLADLARLAAAGKIRQLPGFREKTETNLRRALIARRRRQKETRHLLSWAEPIAADVIGYLKKSPAVKKVDAVGSLRRMKETIGDIDLIVGSSQPEKVVDYFCRYPRAAQVISQGETKGALLHREQVRIDLEVLPLESYGSLLQHFTGSKEHNVALRTWARTKGYSISEYGIKLAKKKALQKFRDEESFYRFLGMDCPAPELREARGEIAAAQKHSLPRLIGYSQIRGDLHVHSNASGDAELRLEEIVTIAKRLGYQYVAISEHTESLGIAGGLSAARLLAHQKKITALNKKLRGLRLLSSVEANIMADGRVDIPDSVLRQLDIVVASVHSSFRQSEAVMTKRILHAIANPHVDIIGHPSGRLLLKRDPYDVEWPEIFQAAATAGVALEVNAHPERLDLNDVLIKEALHSGVKLAISTDAHSHGGFERMMRYGVATARRGWAAAGDVINTWPLPKLLKWCRGKGKL
jgi:DNA polymerase (family 10)